MTDTRTLGPWLRRFLAEHLVSERNLARNTQRSYRDTLVLLLPFVSRARRKPVDRLAVFDLTSERVLQFLAHLEDARGCSPQTRNQRLTAICSFARFVGSRSPEHVEWCTQIRALPRKKAAPKPISYLEKSEIDALLDAPNHGTRQGRRERALLLFLYNTGVRASEAAQLTVGDLQLTVPGSHPSLATVRGKGGKVRQCPLWPRTARLLAALVDGRPAAEQVFLNRHGQPITRFGIGRLVGRCATVASARVSSLVGKRVSPHVIRHTTATHLLRACRRGPQHDSGMARPRQAVSARRGPVPYNNLQDPSVLEFQRRFQDQLRTNNLNSTFGVAQIPADSQFRDLLDSHDYEPLLGCFGDWIGRMQDAKWLQHYQFLDGRYLITMDGSQYFSSYQVNCECCLTATNNGTVRYHHDILQTAIVHPDKRQVLPLAPVFIHNADDSGAKSAKRRKQDCEIKAGYRLPCRAAHP